MAGYYVPSSFSANYVSAKKDDEGRYLYESAENRAGIDAQRSLQQLNKQYNVSINTAYAQHLAANRGMQASALGSGYKANFAQTLQQSLSDQVSQASFSVQDAKQDVYANLGQNLQQIQQVQKQDIDNMRRMAGSLEQYQDYLKTLRSGALRGPDGEELAPSSTYTEDFGFKIGDEYNFQDNYDKLLGTEKGSISKYLDEAGKAGLSWEDWLRQNSGTADDDTAWLDWVYNTGVEQYKDFIGLNKK
jgi:hypothetical protein